MKLGVPFFFCFLYVFSLVLDSDGRRPQIVIDAIGYGFLLFCLLSLLYFLADAFLNLFDKGRKVFGFRQSKKE